MKIFAKLVSILGLWFVRREWHELRDRLTQVYKSHRVDHTGSPSILAQQLLISGEDHRFFDHYGIDIIAICRAVWRGVVLQRREGASTIEMQVVRVVSGRYECTLRRKVREMVLATLVTREIPKGALPAVYLRLGYFGWRMNGFSAACRHINHSPECLTPFETARLVAQLKYPQPCETSPRRRAQIEVRARHLLRLQGSHRQNRTYLGLNTRSPHAIV